jgi:hypothetical protein
VGLYTKSTRARDAGDIEYFVEVEVEVEANGILPTRE